MSERSAEAAGGARVPLVRMVGTDHTLAPVEVRAAFTLPAERRAGALQRVRTLLGATGVAILSTCNRTELWASFDGVPAPPSRQDARGRMCADDALLMALCEAHGLDPAAFAGHFAGRADEDAASHLFHVACGLRSAIVAEDQVISQVKHAIAFAREADCADSVLEVLFRQAVTMAKRVKSGVRFTRAYATAVDQAVALLEADGHDVAGATCLVIGNGEYGRLAASALRERGARVLVTVRQYSHGAVAVPTGCEGVPYADRYGHLAGVQVVMSATTSPHFTLEAGPFAAALPEGRELAVVDLAVPHDVDPAVGALPGVRLLDIDSFATQAGAENAAAIETAQRMLAEGQAEFWDWVARRDEHREAKPPAPLLFPLYVDLSDRRAVVVGAGAIATRRARTLLPFAGGITVVAPDVSPEMERLAVDGSVRLVRERFEPAHLDGAGLVLACTNDRDLNARIFELCRSRGVLVNDCSDRFKCDFQFPAVVIDGSAVVGVNSGGKALRRVKQIRARIERLFGEEDL